VLGRDFVERHFSERRQDMDAQNRLVGAPTALVGFDERQIFFGDELGQARNRSRFLAARLRIFAEDRGRE